MNILYALSIIACAGLATAAADARPPTSFEGRSQCQSYADSAVFQFNRSQHCNCGFGRNGRWQGSFNNHFSWCQNEAQKGWASSEFGIRNRALGQCDCSGSGSNARFCSEYADKAVYHNKRRVHCGCNVSASPRWQSNYNNHFNWCLGSLNAGSGNTVFKEGTARTQTLRKCGCEFLH